MTAGTPQSAPLSAAPLTTEQEAAPLEAPRIGIAITALEQRSHALHRERHHAGPAVECNEPPCAGDRGLVAAARHDLRAARIRSGYLRDALTAAGEFIDFVREECAAHPEWPDEAYSLVGAAAGIDTAIGHILSGGILAESEPVR